MADAFCLARPSSLATDSLPLLTFAEEALRQSHAALHLPVQTYIPFRNLALETLRSLTYTPPLNTDQHYLLTNLQHHARLAHALLTTHGTKLWPSDPANRHHLTPPSPTTAPKSQWFDPTLGPIYHLDFTPSTTTSSFPLCSILATALRLFQNYVLTSDTNFSGWTSTNLRQLWENDMSKGEREPWVKRAQQMREKEIQDVEETALGKAVMEYFERLAYQVLGGEVRLRAEDGEGQGEKMKGLVEEVLKGEKWAERRGLTEQEGDMVVCEKMMEIPGEALSRRDLEATGGLGGLPMFPELPDGIWYG